MTTRQEFIGGRMRAVKRGTDLTAEEKAIVLNSYVHRYTGDHRPQWARTYRDNGKPYQVQFVDDADWLANTWFAVTKTGKLDSRVRECFSSPTWPKGKGD